MTLHMEERSYRVEGVLPPLHPQFPHSDAAILATGSQVLTIRAPGHVAYGSCISCELCCL